MDKKMRIVVVLVAVFCLIGVNYLFGIANEDVTTENFPFGFDGAKWGMSFDEVLNVIKKEGKTVIFAENTYSHEIEAKFELDQIEVTIKYRFDCVDNLASALSSLEIRWPYMALGYPTYHQLKETLSNKYGPPCLDRVSGRGNLTHKDLTIKANDYAYWCPKSNCRGGECKEDVRIYLSCEFDYFNGKTYLDYYAPPLIIKQKLEKYKQLRIEMKKKEEEDFRNRL